MDRYVRNFIGVSIVYLAVASVFGVLMLVKPSMMPTFKFAHSHLMLLGWVTMMIYGVCYHILPRFAGKLIKNTWLGELQFWLSNVGLIGMVVFNPMYASRPDAGALSWALGVSGVMLVASSGIFFYNMITTLYGPEEKPAA